MIRVGKFIYCAHCSYIIPRSHPVVFKQATSWTDKFNRTKAKLQPRMGASWSASSNKEKAASILWTSIDSQPTTRLYDDFKVSVGLSEDASRRAADGATWQIDFEVDVAHLQKRLELCVQTTDQSSVQRLIVEGDRFRKMVERNELSNDDLCNISAIHFKLETRDQEIGEFCLVADIFREGMNDSTADELFRKVYGTTKQNVTERLT